MVRHSPNCVSHALWAAGRHLREVQRGWTAPTGQKCKGAGLLLDNLHILQVQLQHKAVWQLDGLLGALLQVAGSLLGLRLHGRGRRAGSFMQVCKKGLCLPLNCSQRLLSPAMTGCPAAKIHCQCDICMHVSSTGPPNKQDALQLMDSFETRGPLVDCSRFAVLPCCSLWR